MGSPHGSGRKRGPAHGVHTIRNPEGPRRPHRLRRVTYILYWDPAMKSHDRDKFIKAVGMELDGHEKMGNYEPIPLSDVPEGTKLIDMVWSMHRK